MNKGSIADPFAVRCCSIKPPVENIVGKILIVSRYFNFFCGGCLK
ncbi:hypothetical protein BHECKSOX2_1090 [Bathymodiolus heckerae thiotrophic gill symbiont]|nr:hypothetical protein [uncultured Gammaproteobacteria bacterium]SMN13899.1 hypothetical protein BHECKSOX2_1090 [Bathymodiolus heckerae thiotrophic gill symbiont]